jgi:hypothetical protein
MSPNNQLLPQDEVDAANGSVPVLSPDSAADSQMTIAPPATVRELTSTIANSRANLVEAEAVIVAPPISQPLPPPLARRPARRPNWRRPVALAAMAAGIVTLVIVINRPEAAPLLPKIGEQFVEEGQPLRINLGAINRDALPNVRYEFVGAVAPGMQLAPDTGEFVWRTGEADGPSQRTIRVRAAVAGQPDRASETSFRVTVAEVPQPPRFSPTPNLGQLQLEDGVYSIRIQARDQDLPSSELTYTFAAEPALAGPAHVDPQTGLFTWQPAPEEYGKKFRLVFRAGKHGAGDVESSLEVALPDFGDPIDIGKGFSRQFFLSLMEKRNFHLETVAEGVPYRGGTLWQHRCQGVRVLVVEYPNAQAAKHALPDYLSRDELLLPDFVERDGTARLYRQNRLIVLAIGDEPGLIRWLTSVLRPPQKVVVAQNGSANKLGGL